MKILHARIVDVPPAIAMPLHLVSHGEQGHSICDDNGELLVEGIQSWKFAECSRLALAALYRAAQRSDQAMVRPPFHVAMEYVAREGEAPRWAVLDEKRSHIWGGFNSPQSAAIALKLVEAVYAAGAANAKAPCLALVGGAA